MANILYKITIEKGWASFDQKVFKIFYFEDISKATDFLSRLDRVQRSTDRKLGKVTMEQILNSPNTPSTKTYREYARLVLSEGLDGDQIDRSYHFNRFSNMIERIIDEYSTPAIIKKNKKDYETRIWWEDIINKNYPRSTRFTDTDHKEKLISEQSTN